MTDHARKEILESRYQPQHPPQREGEGQKTRSLARSFTAEEPMHASTLRFTDDLILPLPSYTIMMRITCEVGSPLVGEVVITSSLEPAWLVVVISCAPACRATRPHAEDL